MASNLSNSIVEYFGQGKGHSCGYCKAKDTNFSYGMWGHTVKVSDYQELIDRGWRRSGCYLYRPMLEIQCCPMYTIKNDALNFKISNSQKKVIKSFNRYLNFGIQPKDNVKSEVMRDEGHLNEKDLEVIKHNSQDTTIKIKQTPKPGVGEDTSRPKCKKAKQIRAERKKEKLMKKNEMSGDGIMSPASKQHDCEKSLEQYLNEIVENPCHKLRIELVRSKPKNETHIVTTSHSVYKKYQETIHHDDPTEIGADQFTRFLINSALAKEKSDSSNHPGYGSFHQQYWIDDRLVAVGVIDILPKCISSVYLFYDPEFSFLSLGTYTALREIEFVRRLHKIDGDLSSYYMGFYIHSCPKMKYKAQFYPSFLLCPETFTWHPIDRCLPLLESNKYSRFASRDTADEDMGNDVKNILIWYRGLVMRYSDYLERQRFSSCNHHQRNNEGKAEEYVRLVGKRLSEKMLLVRG